LAVTTEVPIVRGAGRPVRFCDALRIDVTVPMTSKVCEPVVCNATSVVDDPAPSVIELPGTSVCPETTNWEAEFALIVLLPATIIGTTAEVVGAGTLRVDVTLPTTSNVRESVVCKAMTVVEAPVPRVSEDPGASVCPPTTNSEAGLALMVLLFTMMTGVAAGIVGAATLKTDVVLPSITTNVCEPVVCSATRVVDEPVPNVIDDPGTNV